MAGDSIKVTLSAMESYGKTFGDYSVKIVEISQSLSTASAEMKTAWDDPAQATFGESMDNMAKRFDKAYACFSAMSSCSTHGAELYKATDQFATSLL